MNIGNILFYGTLGSVGAGLLMQKYPELVAVEHVDIVGILSRVIPLVLAIYAFYAMFIRRWVVESKASHQELDDKISNKHINRLRRKFGNVPPPFPTGWFTLCYSWDLQEGETKYFQVLGEHLVVFRASNGKPRALDAYCPHLGANLAVGGKVVGDCVECPFHGWQFDGDSGKCTKIPYTDQKIPEMAKVRTWKVEEKNQMIIFWYDADGRDPLWELPEIKELNTKAYTWHARTIHEVGAHIQEVAENGADLAHFNVLHHRLFQSISFLVHRWTANWFPDPKDEHVGRLNILQELLLFGKVNIPGTTVNVAIHQLGPGIVSIELKAFFGYYVVYETVTPLAPTKQLVHHVMLGPNHFFGRFMGKLLFDGFHRQFSLDFMVHEFRTFLPQPLLVKNDGPIAAYRRWYSHFYPKTTKTTNGMDW